MKKSPLAFLLLALTIQLLASGCADQSSSTPPTNKEILDTTKLLNKVTLGMSSKTVENLLGKPYSVLEEKSKDKNYSGTEITALYSPKLRLLENQIGEDMRANKNIGTAKSILSGAFSIIGSILPCAGIASTVENSAVGVARDLA